MKFFRNYLLLLIIVSMIIIPAATHSIFAQAGGMPKIPGMGKQFTGKYVNKDFGVEVQIPNKLVAFESATDYGLTLLFMPTDMSDPIAAMSSGSMTLYVTDNAKAEAAAKKGMEKIDPQIREQVEKYKNDCKIITNDESAAKINGRDFKVTTTTSECSGELAMGGTMKTKMKIYDLKADGVSYGMMGTSMMIPGMPVSSDDPFKQLDITVKTFKITSKNLPSVPETKTDIGNKTKSEVKKEVKKETKKEKKEVKKETKKEKKEVKKETKKEKKEVKKETKKEKEAQAAQNNVGIAKGSSTPGCEANNKCYLPFESKIRVGGQVTWTNKDTAVHTVTSGVDAVADGKFDSGLIMSGKAFTFTFDKAGKYNYYCSVHSWMKGTVIVS